MKPARIMRQPNRSATDGRSVESVRAIAHPLDGAAHDYDPLMDLVDNARFVLLGAASHGTYEFYRERARSPSGSSKKKVLRPLPQRRIGPAPIA